MVTDSLGPDPAVMLWLLDGARAKPRRPDRRGQRPAVRTEVTADSSLSALEWVIHGHRPDLSEEEVTLRAWEWTSAGIEPDSAVAWLAGGAWLGDRALCAKFEAAGVTPQMAFLEVLTAGGRRTGSTFFALVKGRELTVEDVARIVGRRRRDVS